MIKYDSYLQLWTSHSPYFGNAASQSLLIYQNTFDILLININQQNLQSPVKETYIQTLFPGQKEDNCFDTLPYNYALFTVLQQVFVSASLAMWVETVPISVQNYLCPQTSLLCMGTSAISQTPIAVKISSSLPVSWWNRHSWPATLKKQR